jgi:hypothetical protein
MACSSVNFIFSSWLHLTCISNQAFFSNRKISSAIKINYRSRVRLCPVRNLAELADGPTVCVRWQGEGICCVLSTNQLSLLFYTRLALNLRLEIPVGLNPASDAPELGRSVHSLTGQQWDTWQWGPAGRRGNQL